VQVGTRLAARLAAWAAACGWMRGTQALPNVALAAWLAADAVRVIVLATDLAGEAIEVAAAVAILLAAGFVLARPRPLAQDARPATVAVALCAILLPGLLSLLGPGIRPDGLPVAVQLLAVLIMGMSIVCLGRNFSVLPQYRFLVIHGPYALVRHPIYASYLLFDGVLAAASAGGLATGLWLAEAVLLSLRARAEERLLEATDACYAQYKARVPYRFVPFVV
jgi:protein-S-isoprenylcysteine O-methyltransferase Ste14